jgi:hypothetical protein
MSHRHRPAFLIVLLVPVIAAIALAGYLLAQSMTDDPEPSPTFESTPEPTAVASTSSPEPSDSTPEAEAEEADAGSLPNLMEYAPDRLADGSLPLPEVASYTDINAWLAAQGLAPGSITEAQASSLALPPILASRGLDPIWQATYGFSLAEVDQILAIGQAPDYVTVLRGRFDPNALMEAWTSGGYQAVEVEGTTVWSLFPVEGNAIDLSRPASQPAMGSFNNVVLLDDGTLIATTKFSRLKDTLDTVRGDAPSMADNGDISDLLALENDERAFVSAVIAKGELLELAPSDTRSAITPDPVTGHDGLLVATPDAGNMPKTRMCLFGLMIDRTTQRLATPEATPIPTTPLHFTVALVLGDGADPADALRVIESRFQNEISVTSNQPYAAAWTLTPAESTESGNVLILELGVKSGSLDWMHILEDRDFGFLTWDDEDDT